MVGGTKGFVSAVPRPKDSGTFSRGCRLELSSSRSTLSQSQSPSCLFDQGFEQHLACSRDSWGSWQLPQLNLADSRLPPSNYALGLRACLGLDLHTTARLPAFTPGHAPQLNGLLARTAMDFS
jgi:hypothetical protein